MAEPNFDIANTGEEVGPQQQSTGQRFPEGIDGRGMLNLGKRNINR